MTSSQFQGIVLKADDDVVKSNHTKRPTYRYHQISEIMYASLSIMILLKGI